MLSSVAIRQTYRGPLPRLPFEKIASTILGRKYDLSVVICSDALAQRMNREYRNKAYAPNVLSFPLTAKEGEIFLNVRQAKREARAFGMSLQQRLALLFVHGCFHLKGLRHGRIMENKEQRVLRAFRLQWHRFTQE
jgi:probable rRNA maturation factor